MMVANDIVELNVRDGDQEIKLKRPNPNASEMTAVHSGGMQMAPVAQPQATGDASVDEPGDEARGLLEITSPMVGTFYAGPDPESPPFVQVGAEVGPSSVVCVLEAMKVFSEIRAELSGTVERVLVKNEEAVEFGQVLFLVRPD